VKPLAGSRFSHGLKITNSPPILFKRSEQLSLWSEQRRADVDWNPALGCRLGDKGQRFVLSS
jgi:hypothetical protein